MKRPEEAYRKYLLESSIPDKIELIKKKTKSGYPMSLFYQPGNGIKTLLQACGRLTDLQGVFIITANKKVHLILAESTNVISEIQKLSRALRVKDKKILEKVSRHYDSSGFLLGQQLLNTSEVNWIEVSSKAERALLMKSLKTMSLFSLQ